MWRPSAVYRPHPPTLTPPPPPQDEFLHEGIHSIHKLSRLGFALYATPDTSKFLSARGVANTRLEYPGVDAAGVASSPLLNAIKEGTVDLVINAAPARTSTQALANFVVRRTAVDFGVPLLTNPGLVKLFAASMEANVRRPFVGLLPQALETYYKAEPESEAWTDPKHFH